MSPFLFVLMQAAILGYALLRGVFLAFSDFMMRALALTRGGGGIEAMQVINREVFRRVFMPLFLGMAAGSLVIAGVGGIVVGGGAGALMVLAGLIHVIGAFGVTVFFNVPMNRTLAGMDPSSEAARAYWTGAYPPRWTFWNTVRTVACAGSSALLLPCPRRSARARATDLRDAADQYSGCQCRPPPRDFPPFSTAPRPFASGEAAAREASTSGNRSRVANAISRLLRPA